MKTLASLAALGLFLAVGVGAECGALGGEAKAGVAGDLALLQGKWETRAGAKGQFRVVLEVDGDRVTADITTAQGLKFQAKGGVRVDDSVTPRALDWVGFTGLDSQDLPEIPAIYEIVGGTWRVCNGGPNGARPAEFGEGENILAGVHVFERLKGAP